MYWIKMTQNFFRCGNISINQYNNVGFYVENFHDNYQKKKLSKNIHGSSKEKKIKTYFVNDRIMKTKSILWCNNPHMYNIRIILEKNHDLNYKECLITESIKLLRCNGRLTDGQVQELLRLWNEGKLDGGMQYLHMCGTK